MIRYRVNRQERLLICRYSGDMSLADWEDGIKRTTTDHPDFASLDTLTDLRGLNTVSTSKDIQEFIRMVREAGLAEHERKSVVLTDRAAHFGMSRMFESLSDGESRVKRLTTSSIAQAAEWLNKPESLLCAELDALAGQESDGGGKNPLQSAH